MAVYDVGLQAADASGQLQRLQRSAGAEPIADVER
jgi:hypothetical protein